VGEKREKGESSETTFFHLSHRRNKKWLDALTVVIWLSLGNLQLSLTGCLRRSGNAKLLMNSLLSIISFIKKENANTMRNDQSFC